MYSCQKKLIFVPERIKKMKKTTKTTKNAPDFHITDFEDDRLIKPQTGGLDIISSVNCDMYDFGQMEDLPDSDRAMISSSQRCKEYH